MLKIKIKELNVKKISLFMEIVVPEYNQALVNEYV